MDADILNLNDDDYLSVEDIMAENEDDQNAQADQKAQDDSVQSVAHTRGTKRRHSICWKNFSIVGDKLSQAISVFLQIWNGQEEHSSVSFCLHLLR